MSDANVLEAAVRTEFGKGAARRTRRAGNVPAVLYGHQSDPQHLSVDALAFAAILRQHGNNAVLNLDINGKKQLALTKSVVVHPIRRYIEHADLLVIKKGEKVTADVTITVTGIPAAGSLVTQEATTVSVEADALSIPESIEVSVENVEPGTQITAADLNLPAGVALDVDAETLIVNIVVAPTANEVDDEEAETEAAE